MNRAATPGRTHMDAKFEYRGPKQRNHQGKAVNPKQITATQSQNSFEEVLKIESQKAITDNGKQTASII